MIQRWGGRNRHGNIRDGRGKGNGLVDPRDDTYINMDQGRPIGDDRTTLNNSSLITPDSPLFTRGHFAMFERLDDVHNVKTRPTFHTFPEIKCPISSQTSVGGNWWIQTEICLVKITFRQ